MKNKNPTIKDVAILCNVGISTVSRVLNNSDKVSKDTRKKILTVIEEIGYSPNLHARTLSSKKSFSLSLVVPDMGNQFYGMLYSTMENIMAENNHRIIVFPLTDKISLQKIKQKTDLIYQTDSVFIASLSVNNIFKKSSIPNKKIILIDSFDERFDSVHVDNFKIGEIAAHYLIEQSNKNSNFLLVTFKELENEFTSHVFSKRDAGFVSTLKKHKIKFETIYSDLFWSGGYEAIKKYFDKFPKKKLNIFTTCDMLGFGIKSYLDEIKFTPFNDYNLISVDDLPLSKVIGLTTIRQPLSEIAEASCDLYFSYLKGRKKIESILLNSSIIKRNTWTMATYM